jgi:simple sugar transport system permease protein
MDLLVSLLASSVILCIPVLFAALGEMVNERTGVLNIGLEGVMLSGAFAAALVFQNSQSFLLAILAALAAGVICWLILGALYLWRQTEQIVTGLLFNLLAFGLTATLFSRYVNEVGEVRTLPKLTFGPLSDIPILGPVLFNQNALVYAALVMVVVIGYVVRRTWFGLRIKAVGEDPMVAYENGIHVIRLRWVALAFGSLLASVGGATIVLSQSGVFLPGMTSGAGFIALAMVVLGRFSALGILIASYGFGLASSIQFYNTALPFASGGARYFWVAFPFVATLIALSVSKGARYPAAIGKEFRV